MALDRGDHLEVITFYSACDLDATADLGKALQANFRGISSLGSAKAIGAKIDLIINSEPTLRARCDES